MKTSIDVTIAHEATPEIVSALGTLLPQLSRSAKSLTLQDLEAIVTAPSNTLLLARDQAQGGRIVGTLTLVMFRIPTGRRAWIEDVVVDSSLRGRGVGEALTHHAVRLAIERGAKTVDLTSRRSREAAHRVYEKAGFVIRETSVYRYDPAATSKPD